MSLDVEAIVLESGTIIQSMKYCNVGFLSLVLYDHLLTFDTEVSKIWTRRWHLPKVIFITNRYVVPPFLFVTVIVQSVPNLGEGLCKNTQWIALPGVVGVMTVELLLVLRVLAFYGNDAKVARFLIMLFLASSISGGVFSAMVLLKTRAFSGGSLIPGCLYYMPNNTYLNWLVPMIMETILISMTIYKATTFGSTNRTVTVLARDSMVYFASIFCLLLVDVIYWRFGEYFSRPGLITPVSVFTCIGASRLQINIRAELSGSVRTISEEAQSMIFRHRRLRGDRLTALRSREGVISGSRTSPTQSLNI